MKMDEERIGLTSYLSTASAMALALTWATKSLRTGVVSSEHKVNGFQALDPGRIASENPENPKENPVRYGTIIGKVWELRGRKVLENNLKQSITSMNLVLKKKCCSFNCWLSIKLFKLQFSTRASKWAGIAGKWGTISFTSLRSS